MDISAKLAEELNIKKSQAEATIKLIDEGNTIPFIARYRKEVTGALNDEILRNLYERLTYLRNLEDKKQSVLGSIEEQGKLTEELKARIEAAETLVVLEDLYRPYKQKRKTRASVAKEKGLEPLAAYILEQNAAAPLIETAQAYVDAEKGVADAKEAIDGAKDIIAEQISDEADYRIYIRNLTFEEGKIVSTAKDEKEQSVYENYYAYEEPIKKVVGHRILALNRGEKEKMLIVKIEAPTDRILRYLEKQVITADNPVTTPVLTEVIADAYTRLIAPAIEREIRNELTEKAEDGAITVFGKNLEQLLMQPPIAGRVVLGWDPAFRTGCKLAVVDETGKVLDTTVIFPTEPQNKVKESKEILKKLIKTEHISFSYEEETGLPLVLEDVNITIGEGEFVAVLGHNGSGKSTFAKHCNAVLLPRTGTVTVDGMNTKDEDKLFEIRQCAGMVFQNPDNQIVATVVEEDVAFAPENMGVEPAEIRRRVDEALKAVGMYEYRESAPHQLSGGQKQRVAIAGIIAMQPRCILLDEPTAMLDPRGRQEVMRVLRQLNREKGITVVLITHYMEEAAACDRVIVMDDGHVLMDDVPRKVFSHVAELRQVGLDVPQTTELMTILKEAGLPVQADIIDEQECIEALEALLTR